jgi:4-oxalocrotonate tautomerase family enzyme
MHDRAYKISGSPGTLAERQVALRAQYAREPSAALVVKRASTVPADGRDAMHGTVVAQNLADPTSPYGVSWSYGIDRAVGGLHDAPNPGELLCAALAACADASIRMCAERLRVPLTQLQVEVSGRLDARGALGESDVTVGFLGLSVVVRLQTAPGAAPARIDRLAAAAERACVVLATLRAGAPVAVTFPNKGGAMPLINVKLIEGVFTPEQKHRIVEDLTEAMVAIEGEPMRSVTWVVVEEVASGEWGIGGRPLTTDAVKALASAETA